MNRFPLLLIILLGCCYISWAQDQADQYWDMETVDKVKQIWRPLDQAPKQVTGLFGQAVFLNGQKTYLNLSSFLQMNQPLTISFWFKPQQLYGEQGLFRQSRFSKQAESEVGRFIEVLLRDRTGILRTESLPSAGQLSNLDLLSSKNQGWLFFTFTGDEFGYEVYLQGQQVAESQDGTMFRAFGDFHNSLLIGQGTKPFIGSIDELKVFYERYDAYAISAMLKAYQKTADDLAAQAAQKQKEKEALTEKSAPSTVVAKKITSLKDRSLAIEDLAIRVNSDQIKVKIWDYYRRIDHDKVSIYLNEESNCIYQGLVLDKKRKATEIIVNLSGQDDHFLIFYADYTGDFYSSATIGVQVEGQDKIYEMTSSKKKNATLRIIPKKRDQLRTKKLPDLLVKQQNLQLEFTPGHNNDKKDGVSFQVQIGNSSTFYNMTLTDEPQQISLALAPDESKNIHIKSSRSDFQSTRSQVAKLTIKENGQTLASHRLPLHLNTYQFNISRSPSIDLVDSGQRNIPLPSKTTKILLELSDHDQPDADNISITYDQKTVVDSLELLAEPFPVHISLNPTLQSHRFYIKANSFGKSQEPINTPRIRIIADGIEVDNFALRLVKSKDGGTAVVEIVQGSK